MPEITMANPLAKHSEKLKVYIRDGEYNKTKELLDRISDTAKIKYIENDFSPTDPVNFAIDNQQEVIAMYLVEKGFSTSKTYKLPNIECDQWCYHDHGHSKCPTEYDALDNAAVKKMYKLRDLIILIREGRRQPGETLHDTGPRASIKQPPAEEPKKKGYERMLPVTLEKDAPRGGAEEARAMLLDYGTNFVTKDGNTLLHKCVSKSAVHIYVLANRGVPVNIQNKAGDTPLHLAVRRGSFSVAEALLQCSADLSIRNQMGQTPLDEAEGDKKDLLLRFVPGVVSSVLEEKSQVLDRLVKHTWCSTDTFVRVNEAQEGKTLFQVGMEKANGSLEAANCCRILHEYRDTSEMIHAVLAEDIAKVKMVLETGKSYSVNVRYRDRRGKTLLSHAVDSNNLDIVKLLVQAGARVNKIRVREHENTDVTVPLFHRALKKSLNPEIAKYLHSVQQQTEGLEKDCIGNTAILRAIEEGADARIVQWLLVSQNGLNITHRNMNGQTAKELAELKERNDIVQTINKFIINQEKKFFYIHFPVSFYGKENLNFTDEKTGKTLTQLAEENGDRDDIKALQHYTEIENRGIALFEAAARGDLEQVQKLNEASFQDKNGYTALIRSIVFNQPEIAKYLCITRPMLRSMPDNCNRYPLHYACCLPLDQGRVFVRILLEKNPEDLEQRVDKDGKYAVEYKAMQGNYYIEQVLYDARTLDAYGKRGPPLGPWPVGAATVPPEKNS